MNTPKRMLLSEPLVQLALAALAGLFLAWPIIQVAGEGGAASFFVYVFGVWGGLVFLLWRIGRAIAQSPSPAPDAGSRHADAAGRES
jgi:hypothetical protein